MTTTKRAAVLLIVVVLIVGVECSFASPQTPAPVVIEDSVTSQVAHWTAVLNRLVLEAKTLQNQSARPEAIAAVADAFWDLDKKKSNELFNAALDSAFSIQPEDQRDKSLRRVIVAAGRRDIDLAKDLTGKLQAREESGPRKQPLMAAIDLVTIDSAAAEAIAIANVRSGPSYETAELLAKLNSENANGATRVFSAYLVNVRREDPSQLLWLAGFPFGSDEAWGGSIDPAKFWGGFTSKDNALNPNPPMARAFLGVAAQTIDRILEDASSLSPPQAENYRALAFFILMYQSQNVDLYRPDLSARWQTLLQNIGSTLQPDRRAAISQQVATIAAARQKRTKPPPNDRQVFDDDSIKSVETLEGVCNRDQAYTNIAVQLSFQQDFKRALSVADKVDNLETRSDVIQFIYFDKALFTISPKSSGDLDEAFAYAQRVGAPDQRGFLYLKFAEFAAKKDSERARLILNDVLKLSDQIEDRKFRASLLFLSAYNLAVLDSSFLEVYTTLEKAIHLLNDDQELNADKIRMLRRIYQKCDAASPSWTGTGEDVGSFNLSETLVRISEKDSRTAEELASELPEGLNRTRTLAAIASARLKSLESSQKTRVRRPAL